jgi:dipicolinate synthase subunit B
MARKHYYFVPFGQDDAIGKPTSLVADFTKIPQTLEAALEGRQIQPVLIR